MSTRTTKRTQKDMADRKSSSDANLLLDRLADAISLMATAASAIEYAEDLPATDDPATWSDKVRCLMIGLRKLSRVRIEIALALQGGRS